MLPTEAKMPPINCMLMVTQCGNYSAECGPSKIANSLLYAAGFLFLSRHLT